MASVPRLAKPKRKLCRNRRCLLTRWKLPIRLLAILTFVFWSIHNSCAQTTTSGGLTGVVTDASHAVVPDAVVEIKDNTKGTSQSARTDRDGVVSILLSGAGKICILTVTRGGFRKDSRTVNVLLGPPVTANVTLEITKASTTVTVIGRGSSVQSENGDFSVTMGQKQISEVPNPRQRSHLYRTNRPGRGDEHGRPGVWWQLFNSRNARYFQSLHLERDEYDRRQW